jgi:hypothetical protein
MHAKLSSPGAHFLAALLVLASSCLGQTATGSITGTVVDQADARIVNARITLTNIETNVPRSTASNNLGYYSFQLLPAARYRLDVEAAGFKRFTQENITLNVAQATVIDVALQVGDATQSVTVVGDAAQLDSGSSSLGQVIDNKRLADLPINGRNSYGFAALVPGVRASRMFQDVAYASYNDQFVSINGSRVNANMFYLDGGANSEPGFNGPGMFPSVDLVQEYKVQTSNFSAEFGNTAGGVINVVTKSGTNQLHGTLFDFVRNDKLNGNDFFANSAGIPIAPLRFNQFGGTVGGPLRVPTVYNGRDRSFFFFSYEGLRWVRAATSTGTMPTLPQRTGDFSQTLNAAGAPVLIYDPLTSRPNPDVTGQFLRTPFASNLIPANRFDPVARNILKFIPPPNAAGNPFTRTNNFVSSNSGLVQKDTYSIRGDHSFTDHQKVFLRFGNNETTVNRPLTYGPDYEVSSVTNGKWDYLRHIQATLNYNMVINPATVLELSSSVIHYHQTRHAPGLDFDPVSLGFPSYFHNIETESCFPVISATGLGVTINIPDSGGGFLGACSNLNQSYDTFLEYGNLTKLKGAHTFKAGASIGSNRWSSRAGTNSTSFSFSPSFTQGPNPLAASSTAGVAFASFLLGVGDTGSMASQTAASFVSYHYYGLYFQDDWKVTPRLTLNLGLRYDFNAPWTEKHDRINSWNGNSPAPLQIPGLRLTGGLAFPGVNGLPRGQFDDDRGNIAPRFGFAFSPNSKTVIRGGAGIFYGPINGAAITNNSTPNTGFAGTTIWAGSLDGITSHDYLANPYPAGLQKGPGSSQGLLTLLGQNIFAMDRSRRTPYSVQWNFGIQRTLPKNFLAEAAYSGSHGVRLFGPLNYDQLPNQYLSLGNNLLTQVPNPFYGIITTGSLSTPTIPFGQLLRPYPQFTSVMAPNNSYGNSIYHSLQAKLERRFSGGLSFLLSYTFSKLIDDAVPSTANLYFAGETFSAGNIQDYYNRRNERSLASYDTPQYFAVNANWELPFGKGKPLANHSGWVNGLAGGWQLNGIVKLVSGAPLGLTTANNTLRNYGSTQRPNLVAGQDPTGPGAIAQYFNVAAFAVPAPYTFGNAGRLLPYLRGPGAANLDLSVMKNIPVYERAHLQFRFEMFNVMNHPQFDFPNTTIGSPTAGVISAQANQPRNIQLALKLIF